MSAKRVVVIGDPQTTFKQFMAVLKARDILTRQSVIRSDTQLVAIGDYFDFGRTGVDRVAAGAAGIQILAWLRAYPKSQVRILLGNHDICRVMEFAHISDADFEQARQLAQAGQADELLARFPDLPSAGVVTRDFSTYCEAQRELIQDCLLDERLSLAEVGRTYDGDEVLITHAGLTNRELGVLGCEDASVSEMAYALNSTLGQAVDAVACRWRSGRNAALNLGALHRAGRAGSEGGGLLYHRPATDVGDWGGGDDGIPRRYHPSKLPRGLLQVCGHTQHRKCAQLLPEVATLAGVPDGALRTLRAGDQGLVYEAGCTRPRHDEGCLWMIDSGLNIWPASQVQALELAALNDTRRPAGS
jgi:hypothetical protein